MCAEKTEDLCLFTLILFLVLLFLEGCGVVADLTTTACQFPGGNPVLYK